MTFARRVFFWAGVYGLLSLFPNYFLEKRIGVVTPPPVTHPEYFYGFVGVALAFQVLFLLIARDPVRYRAAMIPSMIEKFSFGLAGLALFAFQRITPLVLGFAAFDTFLGILFLAAYLKTPRAPFSFTTEGA